MPRQQRLPAHYHVEVGRHADDRQLSLPVLALPLTPVLDLLRTLLLGTSPRRLRRWRCRHGWRWLSGLRNARARGASSSRAAAAPGTTAQDA